MEPLKPNQNKNLEISVNGSNYARFPVKTHVVTDKDSIFDIVEKYAKPFLQDGDILFVSERIVAISQGRAYPITDIHPSWLAKFLSKHVLKTPHGIGIGSPWTMELAIREAGAWRIIMGAAIAAVTRPFGVRGLFYRFVGHDINAIDGPCANTLPPYNGYAKLGPANPNKVARELSEKFGNQIVIIDANDLGVNILGRSSETLDENFCRAMFKDNPLGQSKEQTPMAIVRKIERAAGL